MRPAYSRPARLCRLPLGARYWGKLAGRFLMVFYPVFLAMVGTVWGKAFRGADIPWSLFSYYTGLLIALSWLLPRYRYPHFSIARSVDVAQGAAFIIGYEILLLFLDLILLGVMIQQQVPAETAGGDCPTTQCSYRVPPGLLMLLFVPRLAMLGPAAYVILTTSAPPATWCLLFLSHLLGTPTAWLGYHVLFRRGDLI